MSFFVTLYYVVRNLRTIELYSRLTLTQTLILTWTPDVWWVFWHLLLHLHSVKFFSSFLTPDVWCGVLTFAFTFTFVQKSNSKVKNTYQYFVMRNFQTQTVIFLISEKLHLNLILLEVLWLLATNVFYCN